MAGFDDDVVYGSNVDFRGVSPVVGQMVADGQLLIGSAVAPFIRASTLTAGTGISIQNGAGSVIITNTGGGGGGGGTTSLLGNSGSATQVGGVITVIGASGLTTSGAGSTLTITPTLSLAALEALAGTGYVVQTGANTFTNRTFIAGTGITLSNADGVAAATTITAATSVPTTFTEDAGSAVPSANNINILGTATQGITTAGAGATVTITASNATSTQKGVSSFNATEFTVTAGAVASNAITVTAGTGLTTGGSVNLGGSVTLALDVPVTVAHGGTGDISLAANTVLYGNGTSAVGVTNAGTNGQVLIAATGAAPAFATITGTNGIVFGTGVNALNISNSSIPNSALANSTITVTAGSGISVAGSPVALGGTVTISASGANPNLFTADSGTAVPSGNNLNILGTSGQGISTSGSGATITITAANATTTTKGVASFSSSDFTVSSGAISLLSTGAGKTITGDSGGALSPTANNWNILGGSNITTSGAASTLTVAVSGTTNHAVQLGNSGGSLTSIAVGATGTLLVGASSADPAFATSANGNFTFTSSTSGGTRTLTVNNTSNTASSAAAMVVNVAGGTAADPVYQSTITGGQAYSWGIDNSDGDAWVLAASSALGTTNVMRVDPTGVINYPLQSAFWADINSANNVTGDGTTYNLTFQAPVYDQNSDFAANTFTAPVTGRYAMGFDLHCAQVTSSHTTGQINLIITSGNYTSPNWNFANVRNAGNGISISQSFMRTMTAGDTMTMQIQVSNGTKVIDTTGGDMWAALIC